jgi:hypothetical protein
MPISKKIRDQISGLNIKPDEKKLLLKILEYEDGGLAQYTKTYNLEIKLFLADREEMGN